MNYHGLFKNDGAAQIRVALVGVGDFGETLMDQSRNIDKIEINVICDKDETRMKDAISNSGIKPPPMMVTDITADGLPLSMCWSKLQVSRGPLPPLPNGQSIMAVM